MKNKIKIILLPFVFIFISACICKVFLYIRNLFPIPCILYTFTGFYCPGCGGTRAVSALLKGRFLRCFIDNPIIIIGVLYCILLYIQLFINTFIKGINVKKIIPDSRKINFILSGILIIYYVIRNFIPALYPR